MIQEEHYLKVKSSRHKSCHFTKQTERVIHTLIPSNHDRKRIYRTKYKSCNVDIFINCSLYGVRTCAREAVLYDGYMGSCTVSSTLPDVGYV